MSAHKHIDKICVVITIITVVATILFINGKKLGITGVVDEDAEMYEDTTDFTKNDLNGSWDTSSATLITLDGDEVSVTGTGAYDNDGSVYISGAGRYVISGKLTNGQIVVDSDKSAKIWIMLNGADVYCSDDAAIRIDKADKVFVTLADGTDNRLESGAEYSEAAVSDKISGTVFSRDDLTINGSGSLDITAAYKHGIDVNDSLVITGGTISVTAPQDGIHVNDDVKICNAMLTITAADDAITTDKTCLIESGSVTADGCYEGIEADSIEMRGGEISLHPTDDGLNAETAISISGGNLTVLNDAGRDADGLDSNGDIIITGGSIRISLLGEGSNNAIDHGSERGGACTISGGDVIACGGYVMAEGFSSSSEQCSVFYVYKDGAEAGSTIKLSDTAGNELLSWEVPYSYTAVTLSCPEMKNGQSYVLSIGDKDETITIEEALGAYGDDVDSMFGGNPGDGPMGEPPEGAPGGGPMGDLPEPPDFGN